MYRNFGNMILKTLISTDYTKRKLATIFLFGGTVIVRSILNTMLAIFFETKFIYIDFFVQIFLSVSLVLHTDHIYKIVERVEPEAIELATYVIDNYTPENFRRWKKWIVIPTCLYLILFFSIFETTSVILIQYVLQFLICYYIIDNIENRSGLLVDVYDYTVKKPFKIRRKADMIIIEEYQKPENESCVIELDDFVKIKSD